VNSVPSQMISFQMLSRCCVRLNCVSMYSLVSQSPLVRSGFRALVLYAFFLAHPHYIHSKRFSHFHYNIYKSGSMFSYRRTVWGKVVHHLCKM
jgi:hypothetical protein